MKDTFRPAPHLRVPQRPGMSSASWRARKYLRISDRGRRGARHAPSFADVRSYYVLGQM